MGLLSIPPPVCGLGKLVNYLSHYKRVVLGSDLCREQKRDVGVGEVGGPLGGQILGGG